MQHGELRLECLTKDDDAPWLHRGVQIYIAT